MFNTKLEKRIKNIDEQTGRSFDEVSKRLSKIEEQLKPEPAFKTGDLVNFFLVGNEFEGEIVGKYHTIWDSLNRSEQVQSWSIKYLDKNETLIEVVVKEEDIWVDECDCIDCLQDQIEELSFRLKALENKKK
jgi:pectate lyase